MLKVKAFYEIIYLLVHYTVSGFNCAILGTVVFLCFIDTYCPCFFVYLSNICSSYCCIFFGEWCRQLYGFRYNLPWADGDISCVVPPGVACQCDNRHQKCVCVPGSFLLKSHHHCYIPSDKGIAGKDRDSLGEFLMSCAWVFLCIFLNIL